MVNGTSPRLQRIKNIRDQVKLQSQFGTSQIRSGLLQLRSTVPGVPIVRERINKLRARMGRPPVGESPAQQPPPANGAPPMAAAPGAQAPGAGTFETTPASVLGGQAATVVSGQKTTAQAALNTTVQSMLGGGF